MLFKKSASVAPFYLVLVARCGTWYSTGCVPGTCTRYVPGIENTIVLYSTRPEVYCTGTWDLYPFLVRYTVPGTTMVRSSSQVNATVVTSTGTRFFKTNRLLPLENNKITRSVFFCRNVPKIVSNILRNSLVLG